MEESDLASNINNATKNWCTAWHKHFVDYDISKQLQKKIDEMTEGDLKYPSQSRGFRPKEYGDLDDKLNETTEGPKELVIHLPQDITRRKAMNIIHHVCTKHQHRIGLEATKSRMESTNYIVTKEGFTSILNEVKKKWSQESDEEVQRLQAKYGNSIQRIKPSEEEWQNFIDEKFASTVERLEKEQQKKNEKHRQTEAKKAHKTALEDEVTQNDPQKLLQEIARDAWLQKTAKEAKEKLKNEKEKENAKEAEEGKEASGSASDKKSQKASPLDDPQWNQQTGWSEYKKRLENATEAQEVDHDTHDGRKDEENASDHEEGEKGGEGWDEDQEGEEEEEAPEADEEEAASAPKERNWPDEDEDGFAIMPAVGESEEDMIGKSDQQVIKKKSQETVQVHEKKHVLLSVV